MSTEPVGSLAEEAAKLIAVVQSWAADHGVDAPPDRKPGEDPAGDGDAAASTARHAPHTATAAECRWCPVCQAVRMARATTPEVREHLTSAALSLAMAFKGLMEHVDDDTDRATPVEKIDLDPDPNAPED